MTKFAIQGAALKSLADIAKALRIDEFGVKFEGDSADMTGHDAAHTMLMVATQKLLEPTTEPATVYFKSSKFSDAWSPFFKDERVDVEVNGSSIVLKSGRKKRTTFSIDPRVAVETKFPGELPWTCKLTVPRDFIKDGIAAGEDLADTVGTVFTYDKTGVLTLARGEMGADRYEQGHPASEPSDDIVPVRSEFDYEYLRSAILPCKTETLTMEMATDYPLRMTYDIGGGTLVCLLAPLIGGDA